MQDDPHSNVMAVDRFLHFKRWLDEKCPNVGGQILKNLAASDVHQTTALGNEDDDDEPDNSKERFKEGGKKKHQPPRQIDTFKEKTARVLDRVLDDATFDTHGSSDSAKEWFDQAHKIAAEKAEYDALMGKIKIKTKVEIDPEEIKRLVEAGDPGGILALLEGLGIQKAGGGIRELLLMRHGATHLNDQDTSVDRIRGWMDVPLSEKGQKEAAKLAQKIAKDCPDAIICSDLKRAHDTAKAVADACGLTIAICSPAFRPWDVGEFAGVSSKVGVPILCDYAINKPDENVPGGESFNAFRERFMTGLADALKKIPGRVGLVTHHRNERVLEAWQAAGYPADGHIDGEVFSAKGEGTAGFEWYEVPLARLETAAISKDWKWTPAIDPQLVFDAVPVGDSKPVRVLNDYEAIKQDDKAFDFHVSKVDRERQMVFGWWSVTTIDGVPVIDKQDDVIPTGELEKAVYDWVLKSRQQGEMHEIKGVGRCIESMMFTKEKETAINTYLRDMGSGGMIDMRLEGWWGGFKVDDAKTWADIKDGKLPEFSIGGKGERSDAEEAVAAAAPPPVAKSEPITVNVSVATAKHKRITMHRDEKGNLVADVTESE